MYNLAGDTSFSVADESIPNEGVSKPLTRQPKVLINAHQPNAIIFTSEYDLDSYTLANFGTIPESKSKFVPNSIDTSMESNTVSGLDEGDTKWQYS